jgi:quercetin dioxygenase-like cupin family protein
MTERVIVRERGEGKTVLVGASDYINYRIRSGETDDAYFCFEAATTPGFGPPLHSHGYRELFYVLEGAYEFTVERDGELETILGTPGTTVAVPPNVPHTFKNAGEELGRLLFVHQPAGLESFFEEFGVPVEHVGDMPADAEPPDFAAMGAALERNGVHVLAAPKAA